jgi:predicted nucleic acid-binding protein
LPSFETLALARWIATVTDSLRRTQTVKLGFFEERLRLLPDSLAVHEEWRRLLVTFSISGVQVHDARLVAAMRIHSVTRILTLNQKDFARYAGIEAIHPAALSHG